MKYRLLALTVTVVAVFCCVFGFTACGDTEEQQPATEGLEYEEIKEDGQAVGYAVAGLGKAEDTNIIIPSTYNSKPVIAVSEMAFRFCTMQTSITVPKSVKTIGLLAFEGCIHLKSITLPFVGDGSGKTNFGCIFGARDYDENSRYIPDSLEEVIITGGNKIDAYAFNGCGGSLSSIKLPDSITTIGDGAFTSCSGLFDMKIPDKVTKIGDEVFKFCGNMQSITIPGKITSFGSLSLGFCGRLTDINFSGTKAQWNEIHKAKNWNYLTTDYIVHCTDGDIAKV
ncbi:MAG: leucine-rich repeat domain-containing protein [Clostridia bacterium]|nr:leucine-rich repeat domain-containing protein [Clostridia bacterium]